MVKHTQTIRRQRLRSCLSVFDHIVGLALKGLKTPLLESTSGRLRLNILYSNPLFSSTLRTFIYLVDYKATNDPNLNITRYLRAVY